MTTTNTMTTTIPQAIEAYLQREQRLGCGSELLRTRGFDLRAFAAWLGDRFEVRELAQLRPSHLEAWQTHQSARTTSAGLPLKPGTLNTRFGNLKAWLVHEAGNGTVLDSLPAAIVFVKGPRLLPQGVLSHAQMRKMLRAIDTSHPLGYRDRTLLEVLYSSGIRRGELLGLDTEDVDLDRGLMRVLGKGGKERLVPLGKSARPSPGNLPARDPGLFAAGRRAQPGGVFEQTGQPLEQIGDRRGGEAGCVGLGVGLRGQRAHLPAQLHHRAGQERGEPVARQGIARPRGPAHLATLRAAEHRGVEEDPRQVSSAGARRALGSGREGRLNFFL